MLYTLLAPTISRAFLADPADIFPATKWEKRSHSFEIVPAQGRPLARSGYKFDFFSAKELIAWLQQKSVKL